MKKKYVIYIEDVKRFTETFPDCDVYAVESSGIYRVLKLTDEEVIVYRLTWPEGFIKRTDDQDI